MDVTPHVPEGRQIIQAYGNGGFTVSETRHSGNILIHPDQTFPWAISGFDQFDIEALTPLFERDNALEILLIGCGGKMEFLVPSMRDQIRQRGPVADAMDTGAACRTFNVLMAEGRRVAAALIAVD